MTPPAHAPAARRAHTAAGTRRGVAPPVPRRVSGPARPAPRPQPPAPARPTRPRPRVDGFVGRVPAPALAPRALRSLAALPDHRLVDRLLRSRAWIWLVGLGLIGIVFMQVHLLKLNAGISAAIEQTQRLERQNARLQASVARLSSGERIQAAAARMGMVLPPAGLVRYVQVRPERDARRAVVEMRVPRTDDDLDLAALSAANAFGAGAGTAPAPGATGAAAAGAPAASGVTTAPSPTATGTPAAGTPTAGSAPATGAPTGTAPAAASPVPVATAAPAGSPGG